MPAAVPAAAAVAVESDEELARRLQRQFDSEVASHKQQPSSSESSVAEHEEDGPGGELQVSDHSQASPQAAAAAAPTVPATTSQLVSIALIPCGGGGGMNCVM